MHSMVTIVKNLWNHLVLFWGPRELWYLSPLCLSAERIQQEANDDYKNHLLE